MSNWTHVAGVIRVDAIRARGFEPIDLKAYFSDGMPNGSEGGLDITVWENPDLHCLAAYTVSIFGDLRDHDSAHEIVEVLKQKCKDIWVRQAVVTVENEQNGTENWFYKEEKETEE